MVPKLNIRLRKHFFFSHESDGKARASGYNHTYTDSRNVNLGALATYPTDADIQRVATEAYEEAHGLWEILGADNLHTRHPLVSRLPSVRSWFNPPSQSKQTYGGGARHPVPFDSLSADEETDSMDSSDEGSDDGLNNAGSEDDESPSEMHQILAAMEWLEDEVTSHKEDEKINALAYATTALSVQNTMDM